MRSSRMLLWNVEVFWLEASVDWLAAKGVNQRSMWKSPVLPWFALPNAPTERAPFNEGTTSHEQC